MKRMLDREIPDNYRFYVGEAAREIGMSRRAFYNHIQRGHVRLISPKGNPGRKIIYGRELKRFYYSQMGFDLPE